MLEENLYWIITSIVHLSASTFMYSQTWIGLLYPNVLSIHSNLMADGPLLNVNFTQKLAYCRNQWQSVDAGCRLTCWQDPRLNGFSAMRKGVLHQVTPCWLAVTGAKYSSSQINTLWFISKYIMCWELCCFVWHLLKINNVCLCDLVFLPILKKIIRDHSGRN